VVVPDNPGLIVEARVENKNVGFVHVGMTAEIKTGRRRVISYLLSPPVRYGQEGMWER